MLPTTLAETAAHPDHFVRFYDRDAQLLDEVADFLDDALRAGGAAVAIATAAHRAELSRRLGGFGGPADRGSTWFSGNLVLLDASETLDRFMVGGAPDPVRFEAVLRPVLEKAQPPHPLHAFGEMVAVLCERGEYEAAVTLEALWNDLATRYRFSLFCAYPKRLFADGDRPLIFQHVCAAHSRIRGLWNDAAPDGEVERRLRAERTLRQRERELAEFLENASEGIHKVAADGTILYANRAELELLGYAWEEYVGHNIAEFYVDQDLIRDVLRRLKAGEVLRDQPALLRCKDGSQRAVSIYSNACFEDGKLAYTRCFTRDASERLARDAALEQRNSLILQAPVAAALLCGPELRFELANEAYCRMLGRSDVVGKPFAEVFPELRGSAAEGLLQEVLRTGMRYTDQEHRLSVDLGQGLEERFYKVTLQPLRKPDGSVSGVIAVSADITEQVRASRAKDEFLAMLGHELRNPLSPIVTALQLMRMRGDTGTSREQAIIQRQVEHMVRLVDDLLDVSRITRGKIELKRERVLVASVLAKAVEQASVLLEQRQHQLHIDAEHGLECDCDPVRLAQVVANLLTNAARYTEPGGEIRLRAWRDGATQLAVSVRDNGVGIAADVLPRVFELFYQGQRGVDRAEGGLGIGLALVRSLVELHGGSVEARSAGRGRGSEFIVRLPWSEPAAAAGAGQGSGAQDGVAAARILLVDDNRDAAETLAELLRLHGLEVEVFADPVEALARGPAWRPDVAILDIGLPVMDGYELGAHLRKACGSACRFIALTGYGQDADRARSEAAGFSGHLVKPVAPQQLLAAIEAARRR